MRRTRRNMIVAHFNPARLCPGVDCFYQHRTGGALRRKMKADSAPFESGHSRKEQNGWAPMRDSDIGRKGRETSAQGHGVFEKMVAIARLRG